MTGRFTQPDTTIPDPANPQSLNRYTYTHSNPTNLVDPTGHVPVPLIDGICVIEACGYESAKASSWSEQGAGGHLAGSWTDQFMAQAQGPLNARFYTGWQPDAFDRAVLWWFEDETGCAAGHGASSCVWAGIGLFGGKILKGAKALGHGAIGLGKGIGRATANALGWLGARFADDATEVAARFADDFTFGQKASGQLADRGWTRDLVVDVYNRPTFTHDVLNLATGGPATVYGHADNFYVVVDDVTNEVIQISNRNRATWQPVWNDPKFLP